MSTKPLHLLHLGLAGAAMASLVSCMSGTAAPADTPVPAVPQLSLPAMPGDLPEILQVLSADTSGTLTFPTRHAYDFSVLLNGIGSAPEMKGLGHLYLPENKEQPVPAMIILHGSGGIQEGREHDYAQLFTENGIAGFVVDYYSPRGVTPETPYGMKTMVATETDVIVDAYAALDFLATHPAIDADRIGVIGFSYGGMATRYTLDDRLPEILSPSGHKFAVHADFYGPCHQVLGNNATTGAPYLAVFGDEDNSVDPAACAPVHQKIADAGSPVRVEILKGAGHAWENRQPREELPFPYIRGCTFTFHPETGNLIIDGRETQAAPPEAGLNERLNVRARLAGYVQDCLFTGYIVGRDDTADRSAKDILLEFLEASL